MANPFKNSAAQATLSWTAPTSLFLDWFSYWLTVTDGIAATLTNAMSATDTTIHVAQLKPAPTLITNPVALNTSAGIKSQTAATVIPTIALDSVLVIDTEPMTVSAIVTAGGQIANGYDVTVSRGNNQTNSKASSAKYPLATAATHTAGANVCVLSYASPELWLFSTAVQPALTAAVNALGDKSAAKQFQVSLALALVP